MVIQVRYWNITRFEASISDVLKLNVHPDTSRKVCSALRILIAWFIQHLAPEDEGNGCAPPDNRKNTSWMVKPRFCSESQLRLGLLHLSVSSIFSGVFDRQSSSWMKLATVAAYLWVTLFKTDEHTIIFFGKDYRSFSLHWIPSPDIGMFLIPWML